MSPLVDLVVPKPVMILAGVIQSWPSLMQLDAEELRFLDEYAYEGNRIEEPCPPEMVDMGPYCIDRYPWPNNEIDEPLLGVSAIVETYVNTKGKVTDCESLCDSAGKRLCTWGEWQTACEGTPANACGAQRQWISPNWLKIMRRDPVEMARLDQHARADDHPECRSESGVRMMTTLEEWVTYGGGYAFTRGFWSREGGCNAINRAHAPNWHGYATACRCCMEPEL